MWYNKMYAILFVCLMFSTTVKGSCLEYGHSCWGAHGKRSGGKLLRAGSNLRNGELNILSDAANAKTLFENFDDLTATAENAVQQAGSDEETADLKEAAKLRQLLRQHTVKYRNRNRMDDSNEQDERSGRQHIKSWRRIPLFNLKNFGKAALNTAENELQQQQQQGEQRQGAPRTATAPEEGVYYDFN